MIDVKQLRYNSIVQYKKGHLAKVVAVDYSKELVTVEGLDGHYIDGTYKAEDWEPVPLSESLLIDSGFNTEDYNDGAIGIEIDNYDFVLLMPNKEHGYFRFSIVHGGVPFLIRIDHLHHLQNIILDLSGKELPIKK